MSAAQTSCERSSRDTASHSNMQVTIKAQDSSGLGRRCAHYRPSRCFAVQYEHQLLPMDITSTHPVPDATTSAVLGMFLRSLCQYCSEEHGRTHSVAEFWVYEFAKVRLPIQPAYMVQAMRPPAQ